MFSQRLTRSIAIGATAIAIGGGAYGIVSATASTGSGIATTASSTSATSGQRVPGGGGSNARSGPAAGGSSGTVDSVSKSSFTILTSAGQKVTVKKASSTKYRKGTASSSASAIKKGEASSYLGGPAERRSRPARSSCNRLTAVDLHLLGGRSRPLQARRTVHVKAGRSDPSELQAGVGYDRQRNDGEQSDRSCVGRLPGGCRRPCCEAEQRRVRGPQHRRQLAAPHLRQPGLRGRRRRLGPLIGARPTGASGLAPFASPRQSEDVLHLGVEWFSPAHSNTRASNPAANA